MLLGPYVRVPLACDNFIAAGGAYRNGRPCLGFGGGTATIGRCTRSRASAECPAQGLHGGPVFAMARNLSSLANLILRWTQDYVDISEQTYELQFRQHSASRG